MRAKGSIVGVVLLAVLLFGWSVINPVVAAASESPDGCNPGRSSSNDGGYAMYFRLDGWRYQAAPT